jgi:hypothetical protein
MLEREQPADRFGSIDSDCRWRPLRQNLQNALATANDADQARTS